MGGDVEFPCPGSLNCWGASLVVLEQCLQPNFDFASAIANDFGDDIAVFEEGVEGIEPEI